MARGWLIRIQVDSGGAAPGAAAPDLLDAGAYERLLADEAH